jgi:hypothetical protein
MTTTTTPGTVYRAQTDPTTKNWHLGAEGYGERCFCGVTLISPGDTRAFALKVAERDRHIETSPDLELVTCGACRRNREWKYAHGADRPAERTTTRRTRPAARASAAAAAPTGQESSGDPTARTTGGLSRAEAAQMAAAAADRNGHEPKPSVQRAELDARVLSLLRTYPSRTRHPIADLRTAMDPAPTMTKLKSSLGRLVKDGKATLDSGGYAAADDADTTVARIEAAVADVTGEAGSLDAAADAERRSLDALLLGDDAEQAAYEAEQAAAQEAAAARAMDASITPREPALTAGEQARARRGRAPRTGNPRADRAATRPMSRTAKARALVDSGECATLKDARAYLADMGE